jgi:hypothetical protein
VIKKITPKQVSTELRVYICVLLVISLNLSGDTGDNDCGFMITFSLPEEKYFRILSQLHNGCFPSKFIIHYS